MYTYIYVCIYLYCLFTTTFMYTTTYILYIYELCTWRFVEAQSLESVPSLSNSGAVVPGSTLAPKPYTVNPKPHTLYPTPQTLNPTP